MEHRECSSAQISRESGMDQGWAMHGKLSHSGVSRKQSLVSRMAMRSGSVRLPGERAASRPNNLLGWELSTAVRDTRSRVPYPGLHS